MDKQVMAFVLTLIKTGFAVVVVAVVVLGVATPQQIAEAAAAGAALVAGFNWLDPGDPRYGVGAHVDESSTTE